MAKPKIDAAHGVLNPIEKPFATPKIDLERASAVNIFKSVAQRAYIPNALSRISRFRAIVLRDETIKSIAAEAGSWLSTFFGDGAGGGKEPVLVRIKARIPEIHSSLPIPDGSDGDEGTIDMYPTFIAKNDSLVVPALNSIVYVTFANPNNLTDPIYLGPVVEKELTKPPAGVISPFEKHNTCSGKLCSVKPAGNQMTGKNKAKSHSGLPLLPRKSKKSVSKKNIILRGDNFSNEIVNKWKKAINAKGLPGTSYIGVLPSNGLEDNNHKSGKRQTIIYAPNTTDFSVEVELIYYFHGIKEFGSKYDFTKRYAAQTKKMSEAKRNFVLVIPELPWSINTKNPYLQTGKIWSNGGSFLSFQQEVIGIVNKHFGKRSSVFVSFIAYNAGGAVIKNIVETETAYNPKRIIFADADVQDYVKSTWNNYFIKMKKKDLSRLSIITSKKGTPFMKAKDFKNSTPGVANIVDFEVIDERKPSDIGDFALIYESKLEKDKIKKEEKKGAAEQKTLKADEKQSEKAETATDPKKTSYSNKTSPQQSESKPPVASNAPISPSAKSKKKEKKGGRAPKIIAAIPYQEARVRVKDFGSILSIKDPRLVGIPSRGRTRLVHKLTARRFHALNAAWIKENPGVKGLKVCCGHTIRKWKDFDHFKQTMLGLVAKGKYKSFKDARRYRAFASPHETGLAFDICNNGLFPTSNTIPRQQASKLFKWMMVNAHRFGITPYKAEPWHWEIRIPKESWITGEEFTDNLAVRVISVGSSGADVPRIPASGIPQEGCVTTVKNTT